MKQIGYIYKYSKGERIGIIALAEYYVENEKIRHQSYSMRHPLLFHEDNLLCSVKDGDLVYIDLSQNGKFTIIGKANIANLDIDLVRDIHNAFIHSHTSDSFGLCHISFRDLASARKDFLLELEDDFFDDTIGDADDLDDSCNLEISEENNIDDALELESDKSVKEIYDELINGKYGMEYDTQVVDILNLDFWYCKGTEFYGRNVGEILSLYEVFEEKKEIGKKSVVAKKWRNLLCDFSDKELIEIKKNCPALQCVLPLKFFAKHIANCELGYNFPTKKVCSEYLRYRLQSENTVGGFIELRNALLVNQFNTNIKETTSKMGVSVSMLKESAIKRFKIQLADKYNDKILPLINSLWVKCSESKSGRISQLTESGDEVYILKLGQFLEILTDDTFSFQANYDSIYSFELYDNFDDVDKKDLLPYYQKVVDKAFVEYAKLPYFENKTLHSRVLMNRYTNVLSNMAIERFKEVSQQGWVLIKSLSELKDCIESKFIIEDNIYPIFIRLVDKLSLNELAAFITGEPIGKDWMQMDSLTADMQMYVLERLVSLYNPKKLNEGERIRLSDYNGFYDLEDLILWLTELKSGQYGRIDIPSIERAISKAIEPLDRDTINTLYEKKFLVKPGEKVNTRLCESMKELYDAMGYQQYRDSLYDDDNISCYSGSYAHDEALYSDDDIDTIFDGDPDAYWNID